MNTHTVSQTADLDFVTITPHTDTVKAGETATISCVLTGAGSTPAIAWSRGGVALTGVTANSVYYDGGFSGGTQTDYFMAGGITASIDFICAYTISGAVLSQTLTVDFLVITGSDVVIASGAASVISCALSGATVSPSAVVWVTGGSTISTGSGLTVDQGTYLSGAQTTTLTIDANTITADKIYTCKFTIKGADITLALDVDVVTLTSTADLVLTGDKVTLTCDMLGAQADTSSVTWSVGGSTVTTTSAEPIVIGSFTPADGSKSSTIVADITTSATYSCNFIFTASTVTTTADATIITIAAVDGVAQSGSSAQVTCTLAGSTAEPTILQWKLDGNVLSAGSDYTITTATYSSGGQQSVLTIAAVTADSTYTCNYIISGGAYAATPSVDFVTVTASNTYITTGVPATVTCVLADTTNHASMTVAWKNSGGTTVTSATADITIADGSYDLSTNKQTSTLIAAGLTADTTYTCVWTILTVSLEQAPFVDFVTITPTNAAAESGETATVTCVLSGAQTTPTSIVWSKSGSAVTSGSGNVLTDDGSFVTNTQTVKLEKSSVAAEETFTCAFNIEAATVSNTAHIDLMSITTSATTIQSGETATVTCSISGLATQPSAIVWKNGATTLLTSQSDVTITEGAWNANGGAGTQSTTLQLSGLSADLTVTCTFTVLGVEHPETLDIDYVTVTVVDSLFQTGATSTLSCTVAGYATAPTISWKQSTTTLTSGSGGATIDAGTWSAGGQTTTLQMTGLSANTAYTCIFTVDGHEVTQTVTAYLITITATSTPVQTGVTSSVTCVLTGQPTAPSNVRWKESNQVLVTGVSGVVFPAGSWTNSNTQTNTLTYASLTADTTLTCIFTVNSVAHSKTVDIDFVTITVQDGVSEGSTTAATGKCIVTGAAGTISAVSWIKPDTTTLTSSADQLITTNSPKTESSLAFKNIGATDQTWTCSFTIGSTVLSQTVEFDVVSVAVTDSVIVTGGTATLICALTGSQTAPTTTVWNDGTNDLSTSASETTISTPAFAGGAETTTLEQTGETADGTFTCTFTINSQAIVKTATLDFITLTVTSALLTSGATASLTCVVAGATNNPTAVVWNDGTSDLSDGSGITITTAGDKLQTALVHTSLSSDTTYTCKYTIDGVTIEDTAIVDFMVIAATASADIIEGGTGVTITCVISDLSSAPSTLVWKKDGTATTSADSGVTVDEGAYASGTQTSTLKLTTVAADSTFTCIFTVSSQEVTATQSTDVVDIASIGAITKASTATTITCTVTSATTEPTMSWTDSTSAAVSTGISATVWSSDTKTSTLTVSTLTADTVYTCTAVISTLTITETVSVDVMVITTTGSLSTGNAATLTCVLTDAAATTTTTSWKSSDGTTLSTGSGITFDNTAYSGGTETTKIIIAAPTVDVSYTCFMEWSTTSNTFNEVVALDFVVITPENDLINAGTSATISCLMAGTSTATTGMTWTKTGDAAVTHDGSTYTISSPAAYTTQLITTDTSETFTCVYTIGNAVLTATPVISILIITLPDVVENSGSNTILTCGVTDAPAQPTFSWTDGTTTWTSAHADVKDGTYTNNAMSSHLSVVNSVATKVFTCTVTVSGEANPRTGTLYVTVYSFASIYTPKGSSGVFSCVHTDASVAATAMIFEEEQSDKTWAASGGTVGTMSSSSPYTNTLTIPTASAASEINYRCKVTTASYSYTTHAASLTLLTLTLQPVATSAAIGAAATLSCHFDNPSGSSAAITGAWTKGGSAVASGVTTTTSTNPGTSIIVFSSAAIADAADYICTITYGTLGSLISSTAALAVRGVTTNPSAGENYNGYTVTLTCEVQGEAQATVTWSQGDSSVNQASTSTYSAPTTTSKLVITLSSSSIGSYTCTGGWGDSLRVTSTAAAVSMTTICPAGKYLKESDLTCANCALGYYSVTSGLTACTQCSNSATTLFTASTSARQCYTVTTGYGVMGLAGSALTITAAISTSDTIDSAVWSFGGSTVSGTTQVVSGDETTSTLTVASFSSSNVGPFTCTLTMSNSGNTVTKVVTVTAYEGTITTQPSASAQTEGAVYTLTCVTGPTQGSLAVTTGWLKDGTSVDAGLKVTTVSDSSAVTSTLIFPYILAHMSGSYSCYVKYGASSITSSSSTLVITGLKSFPRQSVGLTGSALTVTCVGVSSGYASGIKWYQAGAEVASDSTAPVIATVESNDGTTYLSTSTLTYATVTTANEGTLSCSMQYSSTWYTSITGHLKVYGITGSPSDFSAIKTLTTNLYCRANGPPQPTFTWLKDSTALTSPTTSVTYSSGEYISTLTISNTASTDAGVYKCTVVWATAGGVTGGSLTSSTGTLTTYGVNDLYSTARVLKGSAQTMTCSIDAYAIPLAVWTKGGISSISGAGIAQTSLTLWQDKYVLDTSNIGINTYGCAAKYKTSSGRYRGPTSATTASIQVYQTCSALTNPTGGSLTCVGTDDNKLCTLSCTSNYFITGTSTYQCTNGVWQHTNLGSCNTIATPLSYSIVITVSYSMTVSCSTGWGPYILASYPYFLNAATLTYASQVSQVAGTFSCTNSPTNCYTADCRKLSIVFTYQQTADLANDVPLTTTFAEIKTYVASTSFNPLTLLAANNKLDADTGLIINKRRKRGTDSLPAGSLDMSSGEVEDDEEDRKRSGATVPHLTQNCPSGTLAKSGKCLECNAGWYADSQECSPCPIGTYQDTSNSTTCTPCPRGSTLLTGATDISLCQEVCEVRGVVHGTVYPEVGTLTSPSSLITIVCDPNYQIEAGNMVKLRCDQNPVCVRVEISSPSEYTIQGASITCTVTSTVTPAVCSWYKDETKISAASVTSLTMPDMYRCVVEAADEGVYTCGVEVDNNVYYSGEYELTVLSPSIQYTSKVLVTGDVLSTVCAADVPAGLTARLQWSKEGTSVGPAKIATSELTMLELAIKDVAVSDSGRYRCSVDYANIGVAVSEDVEVTVLGFIHRLKNVAVLTGTETTLKCSTQSYPGQKFAWTKNGVIINTSDPYVISSLAQSELVVNAGGIYACQTTYRGVLIESSAVVRVEQWGFVTHPLSTVTGGEELVLSCALSEEYSDIEIFWFINDEQAGEITSGASTIRLTSLPVGLNTIDCRTSTGGSNTAWVEMLGVTSQPQDKHSGNGDMVRLSCTMSGFGVQTVTWEKWSWKGYEYFESTSVLTISPVERMFILETNVKGRYRCRFTDSQHDIKSSYAQVNTYYVYMVEEVVRVGSSLYVNCRVRSPSKPYLINWYKSGEMVASRDTPYNAISEEAVSQFYFTGNTDAEVKSIRCEAVFDQFELTSAPISVHPLGIIEHPASVVRVEGGEETVLTCSYYSYPNVVSDVYWDTGVMSVTSEEVSEGNIITSTLTIHDNPQTADVSCTVDYGTHGIATSNVATFTVLEPLSLTMNEGVVRYGEVVTLTAVTPYIGEMPHTFFTANEERIFGKVRTINSTHVIDTIKWPVHDELTFAVTAYYKDGAVTQFTSIAPEGIQSLTASSVTPGADVRITCVINAIRGEVGWYRKCGTLYPEATYIKDNFIYSVIRIPDVGDDEYGIYSCVFSKDEEVFVKDIILKPDNICTSPYLVGGSFGKAEFVRDGGEIKARCDHPYTIANSTEDRLTCNQGKLEGVTPRCVHYNVFSQTTMMITLICAGLLLVCVACLSYYLCYNKPEHIVRPHTPDDVTPDDVTLEKMKAGREFAEDVERFEGGGYCHVDLPKVE